jgi:hypothetical protein
VICHSKFFKRFGEWFVGDENAIIDNGLATKNKGELNSPFENADFLKF